jgi:glycosyltransferase involved in cell wall biosynthesis
MAKELNVKVGLVPASRNGVTIGIPLFNEELFIEAAIRSAAPQCETLLVADNCSTDRSAEICESLAMEFPNLVFVRHDSNLGAANNFNYVMEKAVSPYFMWLGAHDLLPSNYVKCLRRALDSDTAASLAFGSVQHINRLGNEVSRYDYSFASLLSDDEPSNRFHAIIKYLFDCSLIHGLFLTKDIKEVWQDMRFLGGDHVLLANTALAGKLLYVPETHLLRRDVHLSPALGAQLERITGTKQQKQMVWPMQEMQKAQYARAIQVSKRLGRRAVFFRFGTYFWLVSRFGPFSGGMSRHLIETITYQTSRGIRAFRRQLEKRL